MKCYSFRGAVSIIFIFLLMINASNNYVKDTNAKHSIQFSHYKKCIESYSIPTWKLLAPTWNASFYEMFNFRFNGLYEKAYPIARITPTSVTDVQAAVKCGVKTDIQLVPISGGHSYAGLSIGTNESIIIDFRYMTGISINHRNKIASVESGAFLGRVYSTLWNNGKYGAPLGVCATVAMGGLALGGGIGYFSALYGLVIDNLVEINMVDARGDVVRVDPYNNEDLWWAMRGVGPGYIGLVTSVKVKLFNAEDIKLTFVKIRLRNKHFRNVMGNYIKWLDYVKRNDPSLTSVISIRSDKHKNLDESWPGIEIQLLQIKDPRYRNTGNPSFVNVSRVLFPDFVDFDVTFPTFIEFIVKNAIVPVVKTKKIPELIDSQLEFLSSLTRENAIPRFSYFKPFFVKERYRTVDLREAEKVLLEIPNNCCGVWINSEQGAISKRRSNESAYVHRDVLFTMKPFFECGDADQVELSKKWVKNFYESVKFLDSGSTYQNYPDVELTDYLDRYYGSNLEKLIDIKTKWDPNGYFNSKMSIPIN